MLVESQPESMPNEVMCRHEDHGLETEAAGEARKTKLEVAAVQGVWHFNSKTAMISNAESAADCRHRI